MKSGFKPALVRLNLRFKTVLLNTTPRDSMKSTAKPGLGQGLEKKILSNHQSKVFGFDLKINEAFIRFLPQATPYCMDVNHEPLAQT